jgi:hypothetical protein
MTLHVQLQEVRRLPGGDVEQIYSIESNCESLRAIMFNEGRSIRCLFMAGHLLPEWAAILVRRVLRGDPLSPQEEALIRNGRFTPRADLFAA